MLKTWRSEASPVSMKFQLHLTLSILRMIIWCSSMASLQPVLNQVLKKIHPSEKESRDVGTFVSRLHHHAKKLGLDCVVCGSIGKFTWLAGDHDIDLFVFFPKNVEREELEKRGLDVGKKLTSEFGGKWKIKYAEHPYVHAMIKGFDVDIVPCYRIERGEHIKSAVDRSPLHLSYVLNNLKPEQYDEVRLLKQFCKGIGVYGADTKTQGFSGYICEILIMKYGSFEAALQHAEKWHAPHAIGEGDTRKFDAPFIVTDPTDANRNAAAAISAENFARFVFSAGQFLDRPSVEFFFPAAKKLGASDMTKLKNRKTYFTAVVAPRPDVIDDVLWPQLRRARHRLVKELEQNEFKVIRSFEWASGDDEGGKGTIALVFELEVWSLPPLQRMHGPPITSHEHSARFLEKYGRPLFGPFVDGQGNWFIEKARSFERADELLRTFLKRSTKALEEAGIPNFVATAMKNHKLLTDAQFWQFAKSKGVSSLMWKKYMKKLY